MYYLRPGYWESVRGSEDSGYFAAGGFTRGDRSLFGDRDGYILSGGDDIDPFYWGHDPSRGWGA